MSPVNSQVPIFIDTDVGWDDWCAILFLVLSPLAKVVGISVNGCGEAYFSAAFQNARNLLQLAGRIDIPVVRGEQVPSSFSNIFPSDFRKEINEVYGYNLPVSPAPVDTRDPISLLFNAVQEYPDLVYLSIGGLTNFARYLREVPYLERIGPKRVVVMGGAVAGQKGNISDLFPQAYPNNTVSEWNIFIDPVAAQFVAENIGDDRRLITMSLVPLNAAYKVELTQSVVDMFAEATTDVAKFVKYILQKKLDEAKAGGYKEYFYDPLAAASIIYPNLVSRTSGIVTVVTDYNQEDNHLGQTLFTENPESMVEYCHDPDAQNFYRVFSDTILGKP